MYSICFVTLRFSLSASVFTFSSNLGLILIEVGFIVSFLFSMLFSPCLMVIFYRFMFFCQIKKYSY